MQSGGAVRDAEVKGEFKSRVRVESRVKNCIHIVATLKKYNV
jgi:hypothetical protein